MYVGSKGGIDISLNLERKFNRVRKIRNWVLALSIAASAGGALMTMAIPQTVSATNCNSGFLGFPAWYRGRTNSDCELRSLENNGGLGSFILRVGLNVVEMGLVAAAYLSGFFFLYGGFLFIMSQGKPDGAAKARTAMLQAVIGLCISIASIAIVNFIANGILK